MQNKKDYYSHMLKEEETGSDLTKFVKYKEFWHRLGSETTSLKEAEIYDIYDNCYVVDATSLEMTEALDWTDLNWYGTRLYDDKYDTGWLDRTGKFYGCDYESHEEQAEYVHKLTEEDLERDGFIKITKDHTDNYRLIAYFTADDYDKNMQPTKAQLKYMDEIHRTKDCLFWFVSDKLDNEFEPSN